VVSFEKIVRKRGSRSKGDLPSNKRKYHVALLTNLNYVVYYNVAELFGI